MLPAIIGSSCGCLPGSSLVTPAKTLWNAGVGDMKTLLNGTGSSPAMGAGLDSNGAPDFVIVNRSAPDKPFSNPFRRPVIPEMRRPENQFVPCDRLTVFL